MSLCDGILKAEDMLILKLIGLISQGLWEGAPPNRSMSKTRELLGISDVLIPAFAQKRLKHQKRNNVNSSGTGDRDPRNCLFLLLLKVLKTREMLTI